jgi:hypothetical protein
VTVSYGSIELKAIESSIENAIQKFSNLTTLHIREDPPISTRVGSRIFELVVHLDQRDSQGQIGLDIRYKGPPIQFDVLFAHKGSSSPGLWLRSLYFNTPTNELLPGTNDVSTLPFYRSLVKLDVPGLILYTEHFEKLKDLPSLRELSCGHMSGISKGQARIALKDIERLKFTSDTHRRKIDRVVSNVTSLRHLELNSPDYQSIQTSMAEGWTSPRESVKNNLVTLTLGIAHRDCRAISPAFLGLFLSKYFSRGTLLIFTLRGEPAGEQEQELLVWTRHVREFYAYMQMEKLPATPHKGWTQIPPNVNRNIDGQLEGEPTMKTEDNPQDPHEQPE